MTINQFASLLIIIPTVIGVLKIQKIDTKYLFFVFMLLTGSLHEILIFLFKINSSALVYAIAETQLMLALLFAWDKNEYIFIEKGITHIVFLIFSFIDIHCVMNNIYNTRWMDLVLLAILSFYAIVIINQQLSKDEDSKSTISKLFILIPFIVFNIYYIILKILMGILYTKGNQKFFINLYDLIMVINILSYISYSYALLKAPSRDSFLNHKIASE